jgi:hypothetical protein
LHESISFAELVYALRRPSRCSRSWTIRLIAAGVLGLVYGSFSYTKETQEVKLGPLELSMKERQTVNIPVWAGVGSIVVGGALLLFAGKQS